MKANPLIQWFKQINRKWNPAPFIGKNTAQHLAYLRNLQKELETEKSLYIPLQQMNVVIFDIETTGFSPEQGDQILSIGAVKVNHHSTEERKTFYSLVHYNQALSQNIQDLTGLREDDLKKAPLLSDVLLQFYQFIQTGTLVAHHAGHEKRFLQYFHWKLFKKAWKHRIVDTSLVFKLIETDRDLVTLDEYCQYAGVEIVNRHHALGDAQMTAELWDHYVEKLNHVGCFTLHDIYEQLAKKARENPSIF
ncbi:3'-5' exoribonuclease [Lederbergia sp. NSJ-179]|uniref:exonuclease domain-containing protein n=1 Tax=Lederbergia sp. NSJ-179 TaxID=2931402 RepID=UPI001FCFE656|nr:exonuclease domain-containing protein [Lederbergia sp. NSJ-179]MCJ7842059.1 3'-5' exoribonuclease [Lederbergia sp. NSJ-179]